MTCLFDQAVLLLGEIRHRSLLGLKHLTLSHGHLTIILINTNISSVLHHFSSAVLYPTLSLSASGTCLVSLGFGKGDPVFILNSGGTFVSSTTWMGTDSAGCKKNDTKHYFILFFHAKDLSGSVDALWCWIILKSLFSASVIPCDGVLHVHSQMSVTQHLYGLPRPLLPGACQYTMVLLYILYLFSNDTQKHARIVRREFV